jgi:hypothetical protein
MNKFLVAFRLDDLLKEILVDANMTHSNHDTLTMEIDAKISSSSELVV